MSKLAAAIGALVVAVLGARLPSLNIPDQTQQIVAGTIGVIGAGLFPALKAQFDEQKGQLVGVIGIAVAGLVDYIVPGLNIPETVQSVILLVVNGAAALLVPAVTLQQATTFHAIPADTRPSERPSNRGELGEQLGG